MSGSLNSKLSDAIPFLMKGDASGTLTDVNGNDINAWHTDDNAAWFYHSTSFRNLASIKVNGLDPNRGGKNGAGAHVGGKAGKDFVDTSRNFVHATPSTATVKHYAVMREDPQLYVRACGNIGNLQDRKNPQFLNDMAVILRFPQSIPGVVWVPDDHDPRNAWKTNDKIPSAWIQALLTEGWTKLEALTELGRALSPIGGHRMK